MKTLDLSKLKVGDTFKFDSALNLKAGFSNSSGSGTVLLKTDGCKNKKEFEKKAYRSGVGCPWTYEGAECKVIKLNAKSVVIEMDTYKIQPKFHFCKGQFRLPYNQK